MTTEPLEYILGVGYVFALDGSGMLRLLDGTLLPDTPSVRRELAYRAASGYPLTNWSAGDYDPAEPAEPEPEDE